MRLVRFVILASFVVALASCALDRPSSSASPTGQSVAQRQLLIGSWKGETPLGDGGQRSWVVQRNADGTYRIDFTVTDARGGVSTQSEVGIWGCSAGYYFTATRGFSGPQGMQSADTTRPDLYDLYRIIALTDDSFEYQHLPGGNRYLVKRVAAPTAAH